MNLGDIVQAIYRGRFLVSDHADEEARNDRLSLDEIAASVTGGEVIEDYPRDYPYPGCLVLGFNGRGEPIHSVWAYNELPGFAVLITAYRPAPERWTDWRVRRTP
jgi:hypothetical protein